MKSSRKSKGASAHILGLLAALVAASSAHASPQRFAFNYEATSLSAGQFEFENKVSWGHTKSSDGVEFGHELEYGITDNFQIAAILSEWSYEKADGEGSDTNWGSAGLELFYSFANPATDPFGGAVLVESRLGHEEFALEGRLILEKTSVQAASSTTSASKACGKARTTMKPSVNSSRRSVTPTASAAASTSASRPCTTRPG